MLILGDNLALGCDSCGAQLGLGRINVDDVRRKMPSGWMWLDKGRHSCSLCSASQTFPRLRVY